MTEEPTRIQLTSLPTPLEPAPRLAEAIGLGPEDLWLKRDDLTGVGGGGNKLRKLEYFAAVALRNGADVLVTTGAAQSNHARLTAAVAAKLGLRSVLVFPGEPGASSSGNLVVDGLVGARIEWAGDVPLHELGQYADGVAARLAGEGARPLLIPYGGSSSLGARGYVVCAQEILERLPEVRHVVTAAGSGGTMAGLVAGLGVERVLGVDVGARPDLAEAVASFASPLVGATLDPATLRIRDQVGAGYSSYTPETEAAMVLAARTEGVVLDPIYTGRALAGLVAAVRHGEIRAGETTVLVHTGGLPGLFGHPVATSNAQALLR
ncbi:MAG: D-cysteine desulfhydrase family protein [Nocardioidaceae bacterium]|nr:D-cysteine desulfhydrase family protein [Nocardioidaceae bacterium]